MNEKSFVKYFIHRILVLKSVANYIKVRQLSFTFKVIQRNYRRLEYYSEGSSILRGGRLLGGGGVRRISRDRDDRKGANIKTQKNPQGFKQNPQKTLDKNLTPRCPMSDVRCRMSDVQCRCLMSNFRCPMSDV